MLVGQVAEPVFVSYRREDSSDAAGRLAATLHRRFGENFVFMDTSAIEPGDKWPARVQAALDAAQIILVVIGPGWLKASDEYGNRRLDEAGDWVRKELDHGLSSDKVIVPVMVGGARIPPSDKLPPSLEILFDRQVVEVRTNHWEHDVKLLDGLLLSRLKSLTLSPGSEQDVLSSTIYPEPAADKPDPLSEEKLEIALHTSIPKWRMVRSPLPENPERERVELFQLFTFKSFRGAIEFMSEVALGCEMFMHHPRWENIARITRVYLTTFDIGHRISDRDVQLAKYFDRTYADFADASPGDTLEAVTK